MDKKRKQYLQSKTLKILEDEETCSMIMKLYKSLYPITLISEITGISIYHINKVIQIKE